MTLPSACPAVGGSYHDRALVERCWASRSRVGAFTDSQCHSAPVDDLGLCEEHRAEILR